MKGKIFTPCRVSPAYRRASHCSEALVSPLTTALYQHMSHLWFRISGHLHRSRMFSLSSCSTQRNKQVERHKSASLFVRTDVCGCFLQVAQVVQKLHRDLC